MFYRLTIPFYNLNRSMEKAAMQKQRIAPADKRAGPGG
jgi:hypothetical protein